MKVIFDANIWLSYILNRVAPRVIVEVVSFSLESPEIEVLLPHETLAEIERTLRTKSYFVRRVHEEEWESLKKLLAERTSLLPSIKQAGAGVRDASDEYLVAAATFFGANYLVTGDKDLLDPALSKYVRALTPAQFAAILDAHTPQRDSKL